jgi:hypothetical protein
MIITELNMRNSMIITELIIASGSTFVVYMFAKMYNIDRKKNKNVLNKETKSELKTPYRTCDTPTDLKPDEWAKFVGIPGPKPVSDEVKPTSSVIAYSDLHIYFNCPRCGLGAQYNKSTPKYCECNKVDVGHFHLTCNRNDGLGCQAKFIMKAKGTA